MGWSLHHVQLTMPTGGEDDARRFYGDVLEFEEIPKPERLKARGGVWFRRGEVELHLGLEEPFRPARRAHPAIQVPDLAEMAERIEAAGYDTVADDTLPGRRRFYTSDPFGNRLEFLT